MGSFLSLFLLSAGLAACSGDGSGQPQPTSLPGICAQGLGAVQIKNTAQEAVTFSYSSQGSTPFFHSEDLNAGSNEAHLVVAAEAAVYNYTATRKADNQIISSGTFMTSCGQPVHITITDQVVSVYPATHSPLPILQFQGGPVLAAPVMQAISFSNDTSVVTDLEQFTSQIGNSGFWASNTAEYGVSAATTRTPYRMSQTAPTAITDAQIQTILSNMLGAHDSHLGSADGNSLYVFYFPETTTITFDSLKSCVDFGAYHNSVLVPNVGIQVAYAVIPRCAGVNAQETLDFSTEAASHEMIEAVTDPQPFFSSAYTGVDTDHAIWETLLSAESGDLCEHWTDSFFRPADMSYMVQRSWSNLAASQGKDPCAPDLTSEIYFNSAPVLNDTVTYLDPNNAGQVVTTRGVKIPVGSSRTIELDLYSEAATSAWSLAAEELSSGSNLSFSFSAPTGVNGDKVLLTIQVHSKDASYGAEVFAIRSTKLGIKHSWYVVVGN